MEDAASPEAPLRDESGPHWGPGRRRVRDCDDAPRIQPHRAPRPDRSGSRLVPARSNPRPLAPVRRLAISFVVLGVYWVAHHAQFRVIQASDRPFLWINILFLLLIAFVPFATSRWADIPRLGSRSTPTGSSSSPSGVRCTSSGGTPPARPSRPARDLRRVHPRREASDLDFSHP